jgi:hypothetical protein
MNKIVVSALAVLLVLSVLPTGADDRSQGKDSASWTQTVMEEDSVLASVLYIPYLAAMVPLRMIEGVIFPVPATQAVSPPAAHRAPH